MGAFPLLFQFSNLGSFLPCSSGAGLVWSLIRITWVSDNALASPEWGRRRGLLRMCFLGTPTRGHVCGPSAAQRLSAFPILIGYFCLHGICAGLHLLQQYIYFILVHIALIHTLYQTHDKVWLTESSEQSISQRRRLRLERVSHVLKFVKPWNWKTDLRHSGPRVRALN